MRILQRLALKFGDLFLPATLTHTRDLYPRLVFGFSTLGSEEETVVCDT